MMRQDKEWGERREDEKGEGGGHFNIPVTRWWNLIHGSPDTILTFHSNHFYQF